jgi:protein SCO1/2
MRWSSSKTKLLIAACTAAAVASGAFFFRASPGAVASPPEPAPAPEEADRPLGRLSVPDVVLTNQHAQPVSLAGLVRGKTVVVSFVFTRCTTICPPIGIQLSRLRRQLGDSAGKDVELISISLDPAHDTPEKLREWGERFGAGPGWTLLTGAEKDIEKVLKALTVYKPAKEEHSPIVLIGNGLTGEWIRAHALSAPDGLLRSLERLRAGTVPPPGKGAERYFTDAVLTDQDGRSHRLYSDLMRDKTAIFQTFFTSCTGSCPVVTRALTTLQERLGDRLGKDVSILSITLDPENDTPEKLKEYAGRLRARPGWYFLTGETDTLALVRRKLGETARQPDDHSALLLAGNDRTALWKKAFGLAPAEGVIDVLMSVIDDPAQRPVR